jgi:hypothetical protein
MPQGLHPREFLPVENRRKRYNHQGGLGTQLDGHKNPIERQQYQCAHCRKTYEWTSSLDTTDFGDVVDNLCVECRAVLRGMRTNHPEMV